MGIGSNAVWLDVTREGVHAVAPGRSGADHMHRASLPRGWGAPELADAFRECFTELGVRKARADVFWRCDGSSATVVQTTATGKAACDAAVLEEIEGGGLDPLEQVIETEALAATPEGTCVLIGRITHKRFDLLNQAVQDAGAKLGKVFAGESFAARAAVRDAESAGGEDPVLSLAMGQDASVIVIGVGGKTRVVRFAEVGLGALASAYESVFAHHAHVTSKKPNDAMDELIHGCGVPGFDTEICEGVRGVEALRVMQPALQRLGVELKQSIRFQLEQSEQFRVKLRLVGPGAGVRGLLGVLCEQLEVDKDDATTHAGDAGLSSSWLAFPTHCGLSGRAGVVEHSAGLDEGRTLERAWWGGMGAAALLLGAVGGLAFQGAQVSERERNSALDSLEELHATAVTYDEQRAQVASDVLTRAVREDWATSADHGAVLRLIAASLQDDVRIETCRATRGESGSVVSIRARASGPDAEAARAAMQRFVSAIDASVLSSSVEVGSVRIVNEPGLTFAGFETTITIAEIAWAWGDELENEG